MKTCSVDGCNNKHKGKGLCNMHYLRMYTRGTTDKSTTSPGEAITYLFEKVFSHKDKKACLIWPFALSAKGYGQVGIKAKRETSVA